MNNKNINWGYKAMKIDPGIELARNIVRQNKMIDELVANKNYKFDVWEEDGKGYVMTAICNLGGCVARYKVFDNLKDAERHAAFLTLIDAELAIGICQSCQDSLYQEIDDIDYDY